MAATSPTAMSGWRKRIDAKNRGCIWRTAEPCRLITRSSRTATPPRLTAPRVERWISVIIAADKMERELFYVSCSRGRGRVQVFTSDINLLRESVSWSTERYRPQRS